MPAPTPYAMELILRYLKTKNPNTLDEWAGFVLYSKVNNRPEPRIPVVIREQVRQLVYFAWYTYALKGE